VSAAAAAAAAAASRIIRYFVPTLLPALILIIKHVKQARARKILKQKSQ
jgi:hypothetical protein